MKKIILEISSDEIVSALQRMPTDRLERVLERINSGKKGVKTLPSQMRACGMWKNRKDMKDSAQWVRVLRKEWDKRLAKLYGK